MIYTIIKKYPCTLANPEGEFSPYSSHMECPIQPQFSLKQYAKIIKY